MSYSCIFVTRFSLLLMMSLCFTPIAVSAIREEVVYPPPQSDLDTRDRDITELLRTALEKTAPIYGTFTMHSARRYMNPSRFLYEMKQGNDISVIWSAVSAELENELLPIRIPLRKGILGYRVFLIRKHDQAQFSAIANIEQLKTLRAGQGFTWLDVKILRHAGFNVVTGTNYEGLFNMLIANRFDYFSRGVIEASNELAAREAQFPDMAVEKSILLYYPLPKYFYVKKNNSRLAERIERGLEMMITDGSFDEIFHKYNQQYIDQANFGSRKIFKLDNPYLPDTVPHQRKELWFQPPAGIN
jgi:hypothetical protein